MTTYTDTITGSVQISEDLDGSFATVDDTRGDAAPSDVTINADDAFTGTYDQVNTATDTTSIAGRSSVSQTSTSDSGPQQISGDVNTPTVTTSDFGGVNATSTWTFSSDLSQVSVSDISSVNGAGLIGTITDDGQYVAAPAEGDGAAVVAISFVPVMSAAALADGGMAAISASFAPVASASTSADFASVAHTVVASAAASADYASVAHTVAASSEVTSTTDSIGSGGATAAQLQQALDDSGSYLNGAGVTVGVISNSFNELGGAAQDEADGALPPASQVQVIVGDPYSGGSDEGRAMMQVVHDIAPGANLDFASGSGGQQAEADAILALAAAGCKVICDDLSYTNEPMFQLGVISQAIQTVENEGVIYLSAAGNNGSLATGYGAYQANWAPVSGSFDGYNITNAQNFGGSVVQSLSVGGNSGSSVTLMLNWAQPLDDATSNVEVLVFNNGGLYATATNSSSGNAGNPIITLNLPTDANYQIAVVNLSGPSPGAFKEIVYGDDIPTNLGGANVGPLFGHAMTPGDITVGAVNSDDTPAFGVSPATNEYFSSSGYYDQLLFNESGYSLALPDVISPVQISGVDNVSTTVTDDGLNDFQGTSCATPTVAACVALMLEANPDLTLAQVDEILQETASPMANSYVSGAGLLQIDPAVALAAQISPNAINDAITELYVGYYNRAPDPAGENYWVGRLESGMSLSAIAQSYSVQTESTNLYPFLASPNTASTAAVQAFVTSVYENLFNRAPDTAGENYWVTQLQTGASTVGGVIINIISGAQLNDLLTINNKVVVGDYYDTQIYNSNVQFSASVASAALAAVTSSASSVTTAEGLVNAYIATAPHAAQAATASQAEVNLVGVSSSNDLAVAA